MIIKIDLEKTFDTLELSFIRKILLNFNFPINITNLIMSCTTTSRVAILINGDRTNFFKTSRDIRKGDRLSPYIFIMCAEMLSQEIEKAIQQKTLRPNKISKKGPYLSHLFFSDDLVLMAKVDRNSYSNIMKNN